MSTPTVPDQAAGIDAIAQLAVDAADAITIPGDSTDLALVLRGLNVNGEPTVIDLQELRDSHRHPLDYKQGVFTVTDVDSFLEYYDKHAQPHAEIWVNSAGARAVLNAFTSAPGDAGWSAADHVLKLALTPSPEWTRWVNAHGRMVPQDVFAEWLEGAARDIIDPDFATVLEVAQSLEAHSKVEFKSAYRTADGQRAFRYEETTTAKAGQKGELEIPATFFISVRPFLGQEPTTVEARFRYRIQSESLQLGIVIDRIPEILEEAVLGIRGQIAAGIERGIVLSA